MAASVIPALIDAIVEQARAALPADAEVFDGYGVSLTNSTVLHVGVDDPRLVAEAVSARSEQTEETPCIRRETGDVGCATLAWDGTGVQKSPRDRAFAVAGVVQQLCQSGALIAAVPGLDSTTFTSLSFTQDVDENGAVALIAFRVAFEAHLSDPS